MSEKINLGRVVPIFRGTYLPDTEYNPLDVVYYGGSSYVALEESTGVTPGSDSSKWQIVAKKGSETAITDEQIATIESIVYQWMMNQNVVIDGGYTHTDNNYTNEDMAKVAGLSQYANVQPDWNESDSTSDAFIRNKPNIITDDSSLGYVHTDNNYTDSEKLKLASLDPSANANVNPNWNATSGDASILNRPTLAQVATSGSYLDLSDKPTLFDGNYNSLSNKPTIPTRVSQLTNDGVWMTFPTSYDYGVTQSVNIALEGNQYHHCGQLRSLTISSYETNTTIESTVIFSTIADVSLNFTYPNSWLWVTETPLFYAESQSITYMLTVKNGIAKMDVLAGDVSQYTDYVEDNARWSAASWGGDPEDWSDFVGIEPAEPLF